MASFSVFAIRSKYTLILVVLFIFLLFFYCEFVSYWTLPLKWISPPECPSPQCKKLLLVSDPQIVGPEWKKFFLLDIIAIWDSDRYIKRTFVQAVNCIKPDIIIFLGDVMDQGHIATDQEFESYVKRLKYLFELPTSLKDTKVVLAPGDNDVGGVEEILVPANVRRFDRTFNQTEECDLIDFMEFCKVNLMTSVMQPSKFISSDLIRIAISHFPLIPKQSYFLKEVVKKIRPSVIFSGHLHTSFHYTTYENDVWVYKQSAITPEETHSKIYKFHEGLIHEIIVPTCSYRMGVYEMGYGVAFVDSNKKLFHYNVLWLPHRFKQLLVHSVTVLPMIIIMIIKMLKRSRRFVRGQYRDLTRSHNSQVCTLIVVFFFTFLLFFYCEFVSYWVLPLKWISPPECHAPECKKLLLLSDPQLIGPEWNRFFLFDLIAIWDSDRYLKRTFVQAVNFIKPDIIIFLGDLMDQGQNATDEEFDFYVKRFKYLFDLPNSLKNTKVIIAPGDNDVGGVEDILVPASVHRFDRAFNQTEECDLIAFMEFCKVNLMTSVLQPSKFTGSDLIRIALSHVPLIPLQSNILKQVVTNIRPSLIFSGHWHKSFYYSKNEDDLSVYKESAITPEETSSKIYKFEEGLIHEIMVPTCTYRMGVANMGYGVAVIDSNKKLFHYNVLWLPHRFKQLLVYSMTLLPMIIIIIMKILKRSRRYVCVPCRNMTTSHNSHV